MDDQEYRDFLTSIYDRYVRPHRIYLRRHRDDDTVINLYLYHLEQAERVARLIRFIEQDRDSEEDIYKTFTQERLASSVRDTLGSLEFADQVMDRGGFYDAIDAFGPEILDGLKPEHLPSFDDEILRASGRHDADIERRALVQLARARLRRDIGSGNALPTAMRIEPALKLLHDARSDFDNKAELAARPAERSKRSRKWFKGLGQVAQGAALSIANVAVAIGALHFPVSVETKTWGSIVSVVTGIGTIMNGIGDLQGE